MTRNELINDVVRVYFEGGDWKAYAKQLAREVKLGEITFSNDGNMRNNVASSTDIVK